MEEVSKEIPEETIAFMESIIRNRRIVDEASLTDANVEFFSFQRYGDGVVQRCTPWRSRKCHKRVVAA